jgi:cell division septation protein DedD
MSDFYQSPADKLRFEILLKSLREGRLNLAILGDDEVALTYYGRRIFQHLKEQGEQHVELWTSADSEKLVDRFNEILSELTVDQAVDKGNKAAPKRFMIFPDTQAIQEFELQLLARLVNGFPASNINLILLVNNQTAYEKKLATFGKNLLQWVLESENPTPPKLQRIETRDEAASASTRDTSLDKNFTLPPAPLPPLEPPKVSLLSKEPAPLGAAEPLSALDDPIEPVMGEEPPAGTTLSGEELAKEWADNAASSGRGTKIAAVLLVALLGSLATFGFLYQDTIVEEAASLQDYLEGKKPQAQSKPTPSAAPAASVSMSSSNTLPPKSSDIVVSEKEEVLSSTGASSPAPAVVVAPAAPVEVAPVVPPAPAPVAKKPAEIAAEKSVSPDDASWVAKLDADTWVLQHGAFDSLAEAKSFQANSSLFKSAQVLFSQRKGAKSFYIVLTGPYADKAMAETQMRQNPAMAKAWLRTSKSLKAQFPD